jgi:hypothetical protein
VSDAPAAAVTPSLGVGDAAVRSAPASVVRRLRRLFLDGFSVLDIAEELCSFDAERAAPEVRAFMEERGFDLIGVRQEGVVTGYARRERLVSGICGDHRVSFEADDLVPGSASLGDTVRSLHANGRCFVTVLDRVGAIVTFRDLEKPAMRMWLFGMITVLEMTLAQRIRADLPGESWTANLTSERLAMAEVLRAERRRRGQEPDLLDCVQLADKARILLKQPRLMEASRFRSQREAKAVFKGLQSLRNNLAHTQEFISSDWQVIVQLSGWIEELLRSV